jgi:hypothetical protein
MGYLCIYLKAITRAGWIEVFSVKFNRVFIDLMDYSFLYYVSRFSSQGLFYNPDVDIHPVVCLSTDFRLPCSSHIVGQSNEVEGGNTVNGADGAVKTPAP